MSTISYEYAQQSSQPDWFDRDNPFHVSATSGSSPFNEWYAFESRGDAIRALSGSPSQSYVDEFIETDDDIYHHDDVDLDDDGKATIHPGAKPAELADIVRAQSRF